MGGLALLSVVGALAVGPLWAQQEVDLNQALRIAREKNLTLLQQKSAERIARLEERVRQSQRLPSLDVSLSSLYFSEVNEIDLSRTIGIPDRRVQLGGHDRTELQVSVRQPIFTGYRIESGVDLARNRTLSERVKFELLSDEVLHRVYLLYYQAKSLDNQKEILQASLERLGVQLQNVRNLFQAAQAMAFDTLQVYNQRLAVQIDLENNRSARRLTDLQMARLLDLPAVHIVVTAPLPRPASALPTLEELKSQAAQKRPELRRVQLAREEANIQQRLARAAYFPAVFAQANLHYAKPGLDPVQNEWMTYFSAGVSLQWNLWRWKGDRRKVEEFVVLNNRLSLEQRELLRGIENEVAESYEKLSLALKQLRLAEQLQAQQEERYRIVSVQHRTGLASTNELITAETDLTRAQLQTQQALVSYYIHRANLRKAVGTIGEGLQ